MSATQHVLSAQVHVKLPVDLQDVLCLEQPRAPLPRSSRHPEVLQRVIQRLKSLDTTAKQYRSPKAGFQFFACRVVDRI